MISSAKIAPFRLGIWSAAMVCAIAGCAHQPATVEAPNNPVIVRLVSRQRVITISAGTPSPIYTISDASGLLVKNATLAEIRQTHPALHEQIAPLLAPDKAVTDSGIIEDSSLIGLDGP